ncbi:SMEK domain-containing protein [Pseudomonas graminis]
MLLKQNLMQDIRHGLAYLQSGIRPGPKCNLTDLNVMAEDFVCLLLNALNGWALVNANTGRSNYPCIDLIDEVNKIGVQVTSEKGVKKINETIACIGKHGLSEHINKLYVFSLIPRQGTYKVSETAAGVGFSIEDVLDFDYVIKAVNAAGIDLAVMKKVHTVVVDHLPNAFEISRSKLERMRDSLSDNLIVLDRQVLHAPDRYEDPYRMLFAIREIRIELQKKGAAFRVNHVTKQEVTKIRKVLENCERSIQDKFPFLFSAVLEANPLQWSDYPDGSYGESMAEMMSIRSDIVGSISAMTDELERLNRQLG